MPLVGIVPCVDILIGEGCGIGDGIGGGRDSDSVEETGVRGSERLVDPNTSL